MLITEVLSQSTDDAEVALCTHRIYIYFLSKCKVGHIKCIGRKWQSEQRCRLEIQKVLC